MAGIVAVVAFLLLAFAADVPLVAAMVITIAAYLGVVLIRPQVAARPEDTVEESAERAALAYETAIAKVEAIRGLAARVQKEGTRDLVVRIADQSDRSLAAMKEGSNVAAAPLFLEQLLEPAEALLETYVRFSARGVKAADELLARNEGQDLPMIERASRQFFERLQREGGVDLTALREVLEFNLESTTPITPRRPDH